MKRVSEESLGLQWPKSDKQLFTDEEREAARQVKEATGGEGQKWLQPNDPPKRISPDERAEMWNELIRMCIRGVSLKKAATALGVNISTVFKWRHDPEFKLKLARTRALIIEKAQLAQDVGVDPSKVSNLSIEEIVEKASVRALEKLIEKLESPNEHIQLKAAIDLADRNPKISKTKKVQSSHVHAIMTPQQLALIARAAREVTEDFEVGKTIEAVPVEQLEGDVIDENL